ncbi:hypothetical protein JX265_008621 [Neoarthrinium moseri]|uniref:Cytochrome b561 domain-containing protein n=1 Tax=Neoarthrinium moseri TaxID=1658444 RepID=A0A9P9WHU1_9PEZI|nr:hypothetical protein JX265_008621 [Neoarthrinium moseri]
MLATLLGLFSFVVSANAWGPWNDGGGDGNGYDWNNGGGTGSNDDHNGFDDQFGNSVIFDTRSAMFYRNVHGILAALAFAVLFPIGAILMRVIPGRFAWIIHALTQAVAYIIYIVAAALGIYIVRMVRLPPSGSSLFQESQYNAHPIIGLVVLAVVFFQPVLGWVHHVRFKRLGRRTAWSQAHLWVGRVAVTLGIINGGLGLQLAGADKSVIIAYSVVAGVMWLLWAASAVFGEFRRRSRDEKVPNQGPSPPYTAGPSYDGSSLPPGGVNGAAIELQAGKPGDRDTSLSSASTYGAPRSGHR